MPQRYLSEIKITEPMNNKGYSILFLILMMSVLLIFSSSAVFLTSNRTKKDVRIRIFSKALVLAESGIDRTIWRMKGNFAYYPFQKIVYDDFAGGNVRVEVETLGSKIRIISEGNYRGERKKIEVTVINLMPNEMQNALTSLTSLKLSKNKIKWGHLCSKKSIIFSSENIFEDIQVYSGGYGYFPGGRKISSSEYRYFTNLHFYGDSEDSFDSPSDYLQKLPVFCDNLNWKLLKEKAKETGTYFRGSISASEFSSMDNSEKIIFVDTKDGTEFSRDNPFVWADVVIDYPVFQKGCLVVLGNLKFVGRGSGSIYVTNTQTGEHMFLDNVFFSGFIHCAGKFSSAGSGRFFGSIAAALFKEGKTPEIWYDTQLKYRSIPCFSESVAIDSWREVNTEQTRK